MEPTDQPPPTPQTWAETSAWAPSGESAEAAGGPPAPATWAPLPPVLQQQPTPDDFVRPSSLVPDRPARVRNARSPIGYLVLVAVLAELVLIAAGCNQWVGKKVFDYTGVVPQNGFLHQFVYSTQTYYWRVNKASGESTSQWAASLVLIGVVLVLSGLLIALVVRRGSFWRAAVTSLLAVVFSTQVAAVVAGLVRSGGSDVGFTGYYAPLSQINDGVLYGSSYSTSDSSQTLDITFKAISGGGRATQALFGEPTGYRFVGGLILGVLVGIAVGIAAKRLGDGEPQLRSYVPPTPQAPTQTFFPQGEMQRTYESGIAAPPPMLAEPGAIPPRTDPGPRHAVE